MDELPRQVPPPFPPLEVRQRGNAISVRQRPDQDAGWGTLRQPKRFELPLLTPHQLRCRLGVEAVPASEFWQFTTAADITLQVNRISDDRYACCVAVSLLDQWNNRVAMLVSSAGGIGTPVQLPAGTYTVCASLGIAESLSDLRLELHATPVGGALRQQRSVRRHGGDSAQLSLTGLTGAAVVRADPGGVLAATGLRSAGAVHHQRRSMPRAAGAVAVRGACAGRAVSAAAARGWPQVIDGSSRGAACSRGGGMAHLQAVRWLEEPHEPWRARRSAGVVEINSAYVCLTGSAADVAGHLSALASILST